uniref:NADH-ubiquinone oxidoreductase chain 2 n=1 Tax=Neelides sp. FZ-2019 TaxID=2583951 RepID=A0A6H0EYG1_9HEXA|nr:NADH dehydrogenase subunit 2 [Neelides sp. FZ-2019]
MNHQIFLIPLTIGTMITLSADSWILGWIGLEINLMGFIPLIFISPNLKSMEASIKYFLVQAIGSSLIIFSSLIQFYNQNSLNLINISNKFIILALMLKLGAAPLHFWVPQIANTSNWIPLMILLTWQKVAPMSLIINPENLILIIFILSSALMGAIGGMAQNQTKKILAFSSITHSAWMLVNLISEFWMWLIYFFMYSLLTLSAIIIFSINKLIKISSPLLQNLSSSTKMSLALVLFSLGGLPPFPGFFIKLMSIEILWKKSSMMMFLIPMLIISSTCSLYFYSRLNFFMFSNFSFSHKYIKNMTMSYFKYPFSLTILLSISSMFLMNLMTLML